MNLKFLFSHDFRQTALNQLWRLFSGPLLLLAIPFYLTAETQGYWYTFISLAALAVFADMGFSAVLLLFSSHEFAYLKFNPDGTLGGNEKHLARLAGLWVFAMKWSVLMACIVFPIVLLIGFYILSDKPHDVSWIGPWIVYGLGSVLIFVNSMALSFIEGCDSVGDGQRIRFRIAVVSSVSTLILLACGFGLYALAGSLMMAAFSGSVQLVVKYKAAFAQLFRLARKQSRAWMREIAPLLWRYSLSWISGYFIFSIFTPLAFHYYSAVQAGQVGLSVAVCTAIFSIANMWISVVTPKMNMYVARKDFAALDKLFFKSLLFAAGTYVLGVLSFLVVLELLGRYTDARGRLVGGLGLVMLMAGWFCQIVVNALAVYMRAHKREPLMIPSVLTAIHVGAVTWAVAMFFPFDYFFIGFLSAYLWGGPWVIVVFVKSRKGREAYAT